MASDSRRSCHHTDDIPFNIKLGISADLEGGKPTIDDTAASMHPRVAQVLSVEPETDLPLKSSRILGWSGGTPASLGICSAGCILRLNPFLKSIPSHQATVWIVKSGLLEKTESGGAVFRFPTPRMRLRSEFSLCFRSVFLWFPQGVSLGASWPG